MKFAYCNFNYGRLFCTIVNKQHYPNSLEENNNTYKYVETPHGCPYVLEHALYTDEEKQKARNDFIQKHAY